jgi:hypothetical protein
MFLATVTFHLYHPGRVLRGPDSSFPSRSEKKRQNALAKARSESDPDFRFIGADKEPNSREIDLGIRN